MIPRRHLTSYIYPNIREDTTRLFGSCKYIVWRQYLQIPCHNLQPRHRVGWGGLDDVIENTELCGAARHFWREFSSLVISQWPLTIHLHWLTAPHCSTPSLGHVCRHHATLEDTRAWSCRLAPAEYGIEGNPVNLIKMLSSAFVFLPFSSIFRLAFYYLAQLYALEIDLFPKSFAIETSRFFHLI